MTVILKSKDGQAIRKLIPLTTLPESAFNTLCSQLRIEEGSKGTVLFKQGDLKNEFVYLLDGTISLQAAGMEMDSITGGSEDARFALAHQIPRKVFAVAKDKIRFIRIKAEILNSTTSKQQDSVGYDVSDIPEECSGDWMTTLLKSPIFQRLPAANLQKVLTSMEAVEVNAGELVVKQGEPGDYYYIIKKGRCSLTRKPSKNAKEIKLAELKTTDTFGEDSLISGAPRNVNITMLTDGILLRLSKENFLNLVKKPVIQIISIEKAIEEVEKGAVLLDVRTSDSFGHRHIDGSRNVPFFSLRMQMASLEPAKKLIVICEDGNTSEAASFLLIRHAFNAVVLHGGFNALSEQHRVLLSACSQSSAAPPPPDFPEADLYESVADEKQALDEARQIISQLRKQLQVEKEKHTTSEHDQESVRTLPENDIASLPELQKQFETLNREIEISKKETENYRIRLEDTNNKLASSNRQSDQLTAGLNVKLQSLEAELNDRRTELENAVNQLADDQKRIDAFNEKINNQHKQINELNTSFQEKASTLAKEISAKSVVEANLSRIQKESSGQVAKLREQAEKSERLITELQQQLKQSRQSCALLEKQKSEIAELRTGEVESLLGQKQAFEKEAADLQHRLQQVVDETQRTGSEAKDRVDQLLKNQVELEQQFTEKNHDLVSTQNALRESEILARELWDQLDQFAESSAREKQNLQDDFTVQVKALKENRKIQDDLIEEITRLKNEVEKSLREKEYVQEILDTAVAAQASANDEFALTRKELDALKHSFSESEHARNSLVAEKADLNAEIERITLEGNAKQHDQERSLTELSDQCKKFEIEVTELRSRLQQASSKEERLDKEIANLTALNNQLAEHAKEGQHVLKQQVANLKKQKEELETAKSSIDQTLKDQTSRANALEQDLQNTNTLISGMESKISELLATIATGSADNQTILDDLEQTRQSHRELQEVLDQLSANHENGVLNAEIERTGLLTRIANLEQALEITGIELTEAKDSRQASKADHLSAIEELELLKQNKLKFEPEIAGLSDRLERKNRDLEALQEQLGQMQSSDEKSRGIFMELSTRYDESVVLAENLKSSLQNQVETLENQIKHSAADLEELRGGMKLLTNERDDLDLKIQELGAENASLKQALESSDQLGVQLAELQNLSAQHQQEIQQIEEAHAQKIAEALTRQALLEDNVAALKADDSEIQESIANKAQELSSMEEKLFAIRKENSILARRLEELKNGDAEFAGNSGQHSKAQLQIRTLQAQYQAVLDEKMKALNELARLRQENSAMETLVQKFRDQPDANQTAELINCLKTELNTVREQAERDSNRMQDLLNQSQKDLQGLAQNLKTERQRVVELQESSFQHLSLDPALTPADHDLFDMVEEREDRATAPKKSSNQGKTVLGKLIAQRIKKH